MKIFLRLQMLPEEVEEEADLASAMEAKELGGLDSDSEGLDDPQVEFRIMAI